MRELQRFRAAERWLIRCLRRLLDCADEFVHGWEVAVRESAPQVPQIKQELDGQVHCAADKTGNRLALEGAEFPPRRQLKPRRKRRMTAAEFDADMRRRVEARLAGEREMEYAR